MPINLVLTSAALNLLYAVGAFVLLVLALRVLDMLAGFKFREWINDSETDDHAKAVYFGARVIAGALIIGGVVSLPI